MSLGRSYFLTIVCQALAAAAAVVTLRWVTQYVAPETFGQYSLFLSMVSAATLFFVSWPNAALLRFGREEWNASQRVGATFGARGALFVTSVAVATGLAWAFDPWLQHVLHLDSSPFIWMALGIVILPGAELLIYLSQAVGRTEAYGYGPLITKAGFLVAVLMIPVLSPLPPWTYLAAALLLSTLTSAIVVSATLPGRTWHGLAVKGDDISALVRYSWAVPFGGISTYVVNWIDSWVIASVLGVASVGTYNWAYQTTAIASLAFAPIAVVLTPRVIDARLRHDAARLERYARSILPAVLLVTSAIAAALPLLRPLLENFVSPAYASAYFVVVILLAALPFQLVSYLITPIGNAYEGIIPKFVAISGGIAVVNAIGDFVLVPRLGITGAAIATFIALASGAVAQVSVVSRVGIDFGPLWRYLVPAVVLAPGVASLRWIGWSAGAAVLGATAVTVPIVLLAAAKAQSRPLEGTHYGIGALGHALTLTE